MSDKYVGKQYAHYLGYNKKKTYQIVKYPHLINFNTLPRNFVIKPLDLCDSDGVYLIRNNINIKTNKLYDKKNIVKELQFLRSNIFNEHYMHEKMYNGLVPYTGYIVEELLLDCGEIPYDYKCYVFGGKLYYIAVTYNRQKVNDLQTFDSVWFNRQWIPIKNTMIKKGYKYTNLKKPGCFDKMVELVESAGKKLKRHVRLDIYIINNKIYFGEFTFFCGAILHSFYCNLRLGILWLQNIDNYDIHDLKIKELIPNYYNKIS